VKKLLIAVALLSLVVRCAMVANVHSAKTLEPGVSSISLSMDGAAVMYYSDTNTDTTDSLAESDEPMTIPNATLLPNVRFQVGVAENLEAGIMFVPQMLGMEGSVKYRFLRNEGNHLAFAPYVSFYLLKNYTGGTHLVYTRELNDALMLNMSAFSNYTYLDNFEFEDEEVEPSHHFITFGGVFGPQIGGDVFFFSPAFEYNILIPLEEEFGFMHVQTYRVSLNFGWYIGKTKKQLDRIERKIDALGK
jgi:hypothetical protein